MISIRQYAPGELDMLKDAYLADPSRDNSISLFDQTWNDMDMDKVFARIDTCMSRAGQERLYSMLREPFSDSEEVKRRDSLIRYFDINEDIAEAYKKRLGEIGSSIKEPASVTLSKLSSLKSGSIAGHVICALLGLFSLFMIFVSPTAGLLIFLIVLILNITTYFKRKEQIAPYLACFIYLIRSYYAVRSMLKVRDDENMSYRKELRRAAQVLKDVVRGSFLVTGGRGLTGSIFNMLLDYLRIFFHLDLIKFDSMAGNVLAHRDDIERMSYALGEIDAFIAVAGYRRSLPFWCVPEISEGSELQVSGLCHPLLHSPVSSDIHTDGRGVLVTGSNASGKSTFLRSVALSAILGQSIATVYAGSYQAPLFYIISSMAISDDIASGSSYYMAEIKSLKHLMDACDSSRPVLCFVDEVLKGTNTIERIAASSEILKSLVKKNVVCFAATHDLELTDMLADYYANYHFEEDMKDDDIEFSYKLLEGPARTRNAIKLLKIMGYDGKITESAERSASEFEESGTWRRL